VHLTVRLSGLEETNALVVGVPHQPCKLFLSQFPLRSSAESPCAKREPRHFDVGFSERHPVGCCRARRPHGQTTGAGERGCRESGLQEITSGAMIHSSSSNGPDCITFLSAAYQYAGWLARPVVVPNRFRHSSETDEEKSGHNFFSPNLAFFEERRDPFLRVGGQSVHAHHLFRVSVGFGLIEVDLRIERLLSETHGEGARRDDLMSQFAGLGFKLSGGYRPIHK